MKANVMVKKLYFLAIMIILVVASTSKLNATDYVSNKTGNWATTTVWTPTGTPGVNDNVTIANGHTITLNTTTINIASLTIGGGTSGTLIFISTSLCTLSVSGNVTVSAGANFTGPASASSHILNIGGNLVNNGTINFAPSSTRIVLVTFNNTSVDQTYSGSGTATYRQVTLDKGSVSRKVTCTSNASITGSGLFIFTNGTWEQTSATLSCSANETVGANGVLLISGSANYSHPGASLTVIGTCTVNTTGTFSMGTSGNTLSCSGGTAASAINLTAGTVNILGKINLSVGTLTINGASVNINPVGTTAAGHAFQIASAASLNFTSGTVTLQQPCPASGSGYDIAITASTAPSTINISGTAKFVFGSGAGTTVQGDGYEISCNSSAPLQDVEVNTGSVNVTLIPNITINGTLTMTTGNMYIGGQTIGGVLTNLIGQLTLYKAIAGTANNLKQVMHSVNGGALSSLRIYGSGTGNNIPSSITRLSKLNINNSNGTTLQANLQVDTLLTFSSGVVSTGSNTLTLSSSATVSQTSGYVLGNFKKTLVAGSGIAPTFEVGDATGYAPVTLTFGTISTGGDLTVKTTAGEHSAILSSGLNSTKDANIYWSFTNSGIVFDNYSAVFNFVSGQVDGTATPASFLAKNYNSGWSALTLGTLTSTSTQVTGLTSLAGDYVIGEAASSDPTLSVSGSLTNFGMIAVGSSSSEQSYSIAGVNLSADISITPPTGIEVSTGTGAGFDAAKANPLVLSQIGGSVSSTTIYVRCTPTGTGAISGNISNVSSGATTIDVAASGTGISAEPTTQTSAIVFSNIDKTTMTVSWTNGNGANRLVICRITSAPSAAPSDASSYTANAAYGSGQALGGGYVVYNGTGNTVNLTGLTNGSYYYFAAYEYNGSGGTENYKPTPGSAFRAAYMVQSTGTGNWSSTSSWVGGFIPTLQDSVYIAANSTITVDDANATCKVLSFNNATTAKISFGASGVLSLYGNLRIFSATSAFVSSWATGGKLKFTGTADQIIFNLNTSKTTLTSTLYEVQVDKSAGKVTTVTGVADQTFCLGRSLDIINGTFELGDGDDILGYDALGAVATQPTITVQSGGTWSLLSNLNTTYIRSGTSGTGMLNPIGKLTVYGTVTNMNSGSSNGVGFNGVDIMNGGTLYVTAGWTYAKAFGVGTLTVYNGGTYNSSSTSTLWPDGTIANLNSGGSWIVTAPTNTVAATFNNSGNYIYSRVVAGDQTVLDMNYTNLEVKASGNNKLWALAADRTISGNLAVDNSGVLVLSGVGNLTVNGTLSLTSGSITTATGQSINLGSSAALSGETTGKYIAGIVSTTRTLSGDAPVDAAGLGVTINPNSNDLGSTIVTRTAGSAGAVTVDSKTGINRRWKITPTTQPSSPVDVTLSWVSDDDNSKTLTDLYVWKSDDNGTTWAQIAGPFDASSTRSVTFQTSSFSDFTITDGTAPLPVELSSFAADVTGKTVTLKWNTATEVNNSFFSIERSKKSDVKNWIEVGQVRGSGNSNSPKSYSFVDTKVMQSGDFTYRLIQHDNDGTKKSLKEINVTVSVPAQFALDQNYPNPFNPSSEIGYSIPEDAKVTISVYSITGQLIKTIVNEFQNAGFHSVTMDAASMSSGTYIYQMTAGNYRQTRKLVVLK